MLVEEYLSVDDEIMEDGRMSDFIIDVRAGEVLVSVVPPKAQ